MFNSPLNLNMQGCLLTIVPLQSHGVTSSPPSSSTTSLQQMRQAKEQGPPEKALDWEERSERRPRALRGPARHE